MEDAVVRGREGKKGRGFGRSWKSGAKRKGKRSKELDCY